MKKVLLGHQFARVERLQRLDDGLLVCTLQFLELHCMFLTDPPRFAKVLAEVRLDTTIRSITLPVLLVATRPNGSAATIYFISLVHWLVLRNV